MTSIVYRIAEGEGDLVRQSRVTHEKTYKNKDLASLIHKSRLRSIRKVFEKYVPVSEITWADFGCSNGFIPEELARTNEFKFAEIVGHDHIEDSLALAREKKIPNARFKYFDMNKVSHAEEHFGLVTCFETLEHVGDLENSFINLFNHLSRNGIMIIAVPNETGFIGLIKFLGRLAVRRNPYPGFFADQSRFKYMKCLLRNGSIDRFRKPNQPGYGPHLGFDYRTLEEHVKEKFTRNKQLELVEKSFTPLMTNVIYVLKKW